MFGVPGCVVKSSISSLRKNPAPLTYTPDPYRSLSVLVVATALPDGSTTDQCVVSLPSPMRDATRVVGSAWSREMDLAMDLAYDLLVSVDRGTRTNAGSPSLELRSTNARCDADATAWTRSAVPNGSAQPYASRIFSVSVTVIPPEEDGGIEMSEYPRYELRIGSRHTGRYLARSAL